MSKKNSRKDRKKNNQRSTPIVPQNLPALVPVQEEKSVIGRPHEYDTKVKPRLLEIEYWGLLGLTNLEMANNLNIAESTFYEYKKEFSELNESVNKLKPLSNNKVVKSAYQKACGYDYEEETKELDFLRDSSGRVMVDEWERPMMAMVVTKSVKKHVAADTNAFKFWLVNRDKQNWQIKEGKDIKINSDNNTNSNNTQNNQTNNQTNNQFNYFTPEQRLEAYNKYKDMFVKNYDQYQIIDPGPTESI